MKKCPRCGLVKRPTEFHLAPKRKDGLGAYCRPCAKERQIVWRERNREKHREYTKQWTEQNRAFYLAQKRLRYARNPGAAQAQIRKWKAENPEALRDYNINRKARLKPVNGRHTRQQIAELLEKQRGLCVVCKADIREKRHRDHIVPLSAGGSNDITNIQLLCPDCNLSKRAKDMETFLRERSSFAAAT